MPDRFTQITDNVMYNMLLTDNKLVRHNDNCKSVKTSYIKRKTLQDTNKQLYKLKLATETAKSVLYIIYTTLYVIYFIYYIPGNIDSIN